jgi:nucleoside recognition membrane protein YjiH
MVILITFLLGLFLIPSLIGILFIFHVFIRAKKSPADKSNRINHFRLVWFALTRENLFVHHFPWMENDEHDNVTK